MTTLLVVNCNTDAEMTAAIGEVAARAASPGTRIEAVTPAWGPRSAEGYVESFASAVASMDAVKAHSGRFDAIVLAGYGEHGREGVRQLVAETGGQPVIDITEASAFAACLLAHRFGVVTTMASTVAGIRESLHATGILGRCIDVVATGIAVSHIAADVSRTADTLEAAARGLHARGADAIVLGCAGFGGLDLELERRLGLPVIDGVAAAVRLAEGLVGLGKSTSTAGPYAPRDLAKRWSGAPLGSILPSRLR